MRRMTSEKSGWTTSPVLFVCLPQAPRQVLRLGGKMHIYGERFFSLYVEKYFYGNNTIRGAQKIRAVATNLVLCTWGRKQIHGQHWQHRALVKCSLCHTAAVTVRPSYEASKQYSESTDWFADLHYSMNKCMTNSSKLIVLCTVLFPRNTRGNPSLVIGCRSGHRT